MLQPDVLAAFHERLLEADIRPLVVHAPYIINLASPDPTTYRRSLAMYQEEFARCQALRADYLVTHVGSHRGDGEEAGIARVAKAISRTIEAGTKRSRGAAHRVMILLENTAGSGQGLGYSFEQLAAMRSAATQPDRVGVCLDTAHLFASGYAIHTPEGLSSTMADCSRIIGFEHVRVVHLNDSKVAFDSHVDRHWHIGQGHIGLAAMQRIVTHPKLADRAWILETPKDSDDDDPRNLATVRGFVAQPACAA